MRAVLILISIPIVRTCWKQSTFQPHNYAPTTNDDGKIAAHGSISQTCKDQWTEYNNGPDSGINPYRSYMLQAVQIPTENDGRNSATTTNDDGKIAAHGSMSSTQSAGLLTAGKTNSASKKDDGNIATHEFVFAATRSSIRPSVDIEDSGLRLSLKIQEKLRDAYCVSVDQTEGSSLLRRS